jgi:uncharacterized protein YbjQ (UPF0145 family)
MFAVTIDHLPGFEIKEVIGDVTGSIAREWNAFMEGVRGLSGGLNPRTPMVLSAVRRDAVRRMLEAAYERGGNAVIGMRFAHRALNEQWTEVCAYGTAVLVVPARDR